MSIFKRLVRLLATTAIALPTTLCASPLPTLPSYGGDRVVPIYPGPAFDWPVPFDGYMWFVDIAGVSTVPTPVVDFTVTNTAAHARGVDTFQVFGNCDGINAAWKPTFSLFIDETETPWTGVETAPCGYHDFLDFVLPPGDTRFRVMLNDASDAFAAYVDVRFGNVMPAIPLPPAAALMLGGIAALGLAGRGRRTT